MNYKRIYEYRFQGIDQNKRQSIWNVIARYIYKRMNYPEKVLDPAAGRCEFINAISARERWVVDEVDYVSGFRDPEVKVIISDVFNVELPENYFDGVFISNFLEHLSNPESVFILLEKMYKVIKPGGVIAVMGPNYKYSFRDYFDFADHILALSDTAVCEHLYSAGFDIKVNIPRFVPFSFRGTILPFGTFLVHLYLNMAWVWPFFGKQFLVLANKPK